MLVTLFHVDLDIESKMSILLTTEKNNILFAAVNELQYNCLCVETFFVVDPMSTFFY